MTCYVSWSGFPLAGESIFRIDSRLPHIAFRAEPKLYPGPWRWLSAQSTESGTSPWRPRAYNKWIPENLATNLPVGTSIYLHVGNDEVRFKIPSW